MLSIFLVIISLAALTGWYFRRARRSEHELQRLRHTVLQLQAEAIEGQQKLAFMREDPVTHLLGRPLFEDRVAQNLKECDRNQFIMGVVYLEVNEFEVIRDALGEEVTDALLNELALRLKECVRQIDSLSRFEKATFVILLAQLSKPETAAMVLQRILQAMALPIDVEQHEIHVSVCMGVALYPSDAHDMPSLLRHAEYAMQRAKDKDKQGYQFYQEKMHIESQRDLAIYNSLSREAILQEFVLYYQPTVDIAKESVFCMDALVHWQHTEFGLVDADTLCEHAEKQRRLDALSMWLLKRAIRQFKLWQRAGFHPEKLGVPFSIKQLQNSQFIYEVSQLLQSESFHPGALLVLIKDDFADVSLDIIEKSLNMLSYLGIAIVIDHFGAGSFAPRYLKNMIINYLRLDRAFIDDIVENEQTRALVISVLFLAQTMSMQLIVQGVEARQQMALLKELGCTLMMGPLLGASLAEDDVIATMAVSIA